MAEENIVTNIVAKSDFSNLIGDLNKVSSRLAALQQQLSNTNKTLSVQASQMQKAFADTMRSTGQFSTHFVSLTSDVDKFGKSLDSGQMKLGQYYRTWQQHAKTSGGLIRQLATQQVQLQNAVMQPLGKNAQGLMQFNVHIPQGLDKIKNSAALARQEMQIMNKVIQDGANQVINWGKNTQWAGRQLSVGLTLPIAAFGKAAADAFKQADQELVRLTKVYGGVAATSAADLAKIRKEVAETAKQMSSEYGASYKETIALAADIAATGKQGNELLVATQETTRLSVLGEVDRQEAMKATLAIQSAFKQNTTELSESINFLNAVENQTSTSLADLVEAIPKAGPVVKALGGDVQDLALYLTAMREGGINASEGANALKSALASIINPTKVAKEQFAGFGINLEGIVNKNAGNLTGTILEIQAALETLDPLKKSKAIEQLFGKFQFARMNALFENLGKQGSQTLQVLDLMKASSQDLANVAGRELSQITESASGRYKRALESLKADLAGVGEQFLNVATKFINVLDSVIKFFNKLPSPVKTIMAVVTGLTALTGPIIMLTGLMANFFGYIAKGLFHFKALIKGGEGFKLLTPEILAAEKAGSLMETTFYDDAKAAAILQKAISNLTAELSLLEVKANSARTAVGPSIKTTAGSVIIEGADRVVDPNHPKLGKPYTRASSHVNPLGDMTTDQRALQNIFSFVPGTEPVNRDIGKNPQMYMQSDLPKVEGVSAFKGTSSGIVAQEAAKWHAMTAAIAMQSEAEIKTLKAEVAATGTITHELSSSYQALLPPMTEITSMAAAESAAIVAELQMGKTTVDQARAKIIALNANVEAMLAETTAATAAGMGRTANITTVPLTNQPVVDPLTGKSNMREMFKKNSGIVDRIARILGVKTSGGSYSIETTKPKRFATGGNVVPGHGNSDTVPAMLTPGEFVINKKATAENLPLLEAINNGKGSGGPGYINGGQIQSLLNMPRAFASRINLISGARRTDTRSLRRVFSPGAQDYDQMSSRAGRDRAWNNPALALGRPNRDEVVGHIYNNQFYKTYGQPTSGSSPRATSDEFSSLTGLSLSSSRSGYSGTYDILPNQFMTIPQSFNIKLNRGGAKKYDWLSNPRKPEHLLSLMELLTSQGIPLNKSRGVAQQVLNRINNKISALPEDAVITERMFGNIVTNSTKVEMNVLRGMGELAERSAAEAARRLPVGRPASGPLASLPSNRPVKRNNGGVIPGYALGGLVGGSASKILSSLLYTPANKLFQLKNYFKARNMVKQGMFHGSAAKGLRGEDYLEGRNVIDSAISRDKYYGMGFYSTTSPQEANLYAGGYNTNANGDTFGSLNQVLNVPKGNYVDLTKKNLKLQNIKLYRALGGKDFGYAGEELGPILRELGIKGAILPRVGGGRSGSEEIDLAQWLAWADPNGVITNEIFNNPNRKIPKRENGGPVNSGKPYLVGERGPELFVPSKSGGILSNNSIKGYARGGIVGQTLLSTAGSLGGGMIGNMFGGQMGMMAGSMLGGMLPMGMGRRSSGYDIPEKSILATTKYGNSLSYAATGGSRLSTILPKMLLGITKLNAGIAIGSVVVGAAYTWWKKHQEALRLNTLGYGLTEEAASKAGLKFKSFNSTMKDTIENIKAMKEKNDLVYQSLTMSNTPLNMTIEQYKKFKKEVQSVYSDQIKLINQSKKGDLADVATRIKEQLVAAGMSAEEATKKIYAMFKVSNKSSEALSATVNNASFNKIKDSVSAAEAAINSYAKATSTVGGKGQAAQLNTALMAIDAASPNSEKEQATLERINRLKSSGVKITQATINELAKTNPIINEFANTQDTVVSLWQKIKLATAGYIGDLSKLSAEQTSALSKASAIINKTTIQTTQNGLLKSQYANLKKLTDLRTKYENASKGQSVASQIDSRKAIDAINKEIDAINKRAEAKKKALQDEQTAEDYITQLKRKQMEYTDALAAGDMSRASQAQLDINQLTSTRQRSLAVDAIDAQAKSDIAKLEGKKSKLEAANQSIADNASLAGEGLGKLTEKIDKQKAQIDGVNTSLSSFKLNLDAWLVKNTGKTEADYIKTKEGRGLAAGITQSYKDAGLGTPKSEVPSFINNWKGKSAADIGLELSKNTNSAISSALEKSGIQMGSGDIIINGQKVDMTKNNKNKPTPSSYPYSQYGGGTYTYRNHATGGYILGPGNGTSDSIPAMLSNGEYVINAKSVQAAGLPMLDKINKMASGGLATRFDIPTSSMGRASFANGGSATSSNALYNINVNVAGTNANPNDIAKAISQEMRLREAMNGVGRRI